MARSDTHHFGLMNAWARIMHEDLWRFNQILGTGVILAPGCGDDNVYIQYERDYIAAAINTAIKQVADALHFYPLPVYVVNEQIPINPDLEWDCQVYSLKYGYLQSFGVRTAVELDADATVTFSDANGDSVTDQGAITVTAPFSSEVQVFYRSDDGASNDGHPNWRIDDLLPTDNEDGTITLIGHKGHFTDPSIWAAEYSTPEFRARNVGDTQTPGHFVSTVDVYQVYPDDSEAVVLVTETGAETVVDTVVQDAERGLFTIKKLTDTPPATGHHHLRVSYLAGYPLDPLTLRMATELEMDVIRYANVFFPQRPSAFCDRVMAMWVNDLTDVTTDLLIEGNPLQEPQTGAARNLWAKLLTIRHAETKAADSNRFLAV